jgi:hypothetical protein
MVSSPVKRVSVEPLDGSFGADRGRRIVVAFVPGREGIPDRLELRPLGTRRAESLAVVDVYRYALRCRVGRDLLERARARKAAKAVRLAAQRQQRAERRLVITKKLE